MGSYVVDVFGIFYGMKENVFSVLVLCYLYHPHVTFFSLTIDTELCIKQERTVHVCPGDGRTEGAFCIVVGRFQ